MNSIKRLRVRVLPKAEIREYHVSAELADNRYNGMMRGRDLHYSPIDELSDRDKHLIDTLYDATHGVNVVSLEPCGVSIEKGYAFDWDEIEDLIITSSWPTLGGTARTSRSSNRRSRSCRSSRPRTSSLAFRASSTGSRSRSGSSTTSDTCHSARPDSSLCPRTQSYQRYFWWLWVREITKSRLKGGF